MTSGLRHRDRDVILAEADKSFVTNASNEDDDWAPLPEETVLTPEANAAARDATSCADAACHVSAMPR